MGALKKDKPSKAKLILTFDKVRREYIRLRDGDWKGYGNCISCYISKSVKELEVGHFEKRQHDFQTFLASAQENTNLQCSLCNGLPDGNRERYKVGLVRKYGENILLKLKQAKRRHHWRYTEIEELIEKYRMNIQDLK